MHEAVNLNRNVHTIYELVKFIGRDFMHKRNTEHYLCVCIFLWLMRERAPTIALLGIESHLLRPFSLPLNNRITKCLMENRHVLRTCPAQAHVCCTDSAGSTEYFMWVAVHIRIYLLVRTPIMSTDDCCVRDAYTHCYLVWIKSNFLFIVSLLEDGSSSASSSFSDSALDCAPTKTIPDTFNFGEHMKHSYFVCCKIIWGRRRRWPFFSEVSRWERKSCSRTQSMIVSWRDAEKMWKITSNVSSLRIFIDLLRYCELWMPGNLRISWILIILNTPKKDRTEMSPHPFQDWMGCSCSVRMECANWIVWRKKCRKSNTK